MNTSLGMLGISSLNRLKQQGEKTLERNTARIIDDSEKKGPSRVGFKFREEKEDLIGKASVTHSRFWPR